MEMWRVLLIACFVSQVHAVESCGDVCTRCSSESTVELSCPDNDVIQVLEKFVVINCTGENICSATSLCVHRLHLSELRPVCNGRQLCNETVSELTGTEFSNGSQTQYYQVNYKCVSLSFTSNMCGDDYTSSEVIYLVSPDFPALTSLASKPQCRCRVQGESIAVTAVQIDLPFNDSTLTLSDVTDNRTLWPLVKMQSTALYNTLLYNGTGFQRVDIVFNKSLVPYQIAWIEVKAAQGLINFGCNLREIFVTPVSRLTSTMFPAPSASKATNAQRTDSSSSGDQIIISTTEELSTSAPNTTAASPVSRARGKVAEIVVPILISLVVIAAVIVICVFLRRRRAGREKKSDDLERSEAENGDLYTRVTKSKPGLNEEPTASVKSAGKTVAGPETDVPGDGGVHISSADNVAYANNVHGVGEITTQRRAGSQDAASGKTAEGKQADRLKTDWRRHNDCLGYSEVEIPEDASVPKLLGKNASSQAQPDNAKSDKDRTDETASSFNPSPLNNTEDARTEPGAAKAPNLKPELSLRSRPAEVQTNLPTIHDLTDGALNHYSEIDPVPESESTENSTPAPPATPHHYSNIEFPDDNKLPDNSVFQGKKKKSAKHPPHKYWVLEPGTEATRKTEARKPGTFNVEIVPLKRSKSVEPHPWEKDTLQSRGGSERQRVVDASRDEHRAMETPVPNPAQSSTTLSSAYADIDDDEVLDMEPSSASSDPPLPPPPPPSPPAPTSSPPAAASRPAAAVAALVASRGPERDSCSVAPGYEPVDTGGNSPMGALPTKPLSSSEDRPVTASVSGLYEEIDKSRWDAATGANASSAGTAVADAGMLQAGDAVNGPLLPQDPATSGPDKEDVLVYNILYESFQNANKKTEK